MSTDTLVDFLNTFDEEELPDDRAAVAWFKAHGLPTKGLRAAEARRVRNALRCALEGRESLPRDLACVPLYACRDDVGGLTLSSDHPLGPILGVAVQLSFEGRWDRLKLCDADTCRYAFYDESRNRSGRWCDMAVCGNRAKTKAFRERHSGARTTR